MTGTKAGLRAGNQAGWAPGLSERARTNTQAVLRLAWGGLAKGNQSVQQAEASIVSQNLDWRPELRGPSGAWGQGPQDLGAQ